MIAMRLLGPILLALLGSVRAPAGDPDPHVLESLRFLVDQDKNGDGVLTAEEIPASQLQHYDVNHDGRVQRVEILVTLGTTKAILENITKIRIIRPPLYWFAFHDDGDGRLDRKELDRFLFGVLDRDDDGLLSSHELRALYPHVRFQGTPAELIALLIRVCDRDHDSILTQDEFSVPDKIRRAFDRDGDGTVSQDEIVEVEIEQLGGRIARLSRLRQLFPQNPSQTFTQADIGGPPRRFEQLDQDHDRRVDFSELDSYVRELRQVLRYATDFVTRHDLDGNGRVSPDEFEGPPRLFARMDHDGDGFITRKDR